MPGTTAGRLGLALGAVAGIFAWLATVGLAAASGASIDHILSVRSELGSAAIALVVVAAALYYLRERSLTKTAYTGFFFGFVIGLGILAIPTDLLF